MLPTPATKGANVRTMGTKRASTTVLPPYLPMLECGGAGTCARAQSKGETQRLAAACLGAWAAEPPSQVAWQTGVLAQRHPLFVKGLSLRNVLLLEQLLVQRPAALPCVWREEEGSGATRCGLGNNTHLPRGAGTSMHHTSACRRPCCCSSAQPVRSSLRPHHSACALRSLLAIRPRTRDPQHGTSYLKTEDPLAEAFQPPHPACCRLHS
jgi:hypothetical protein